jgi:hypothetical protein
MVLAGTGPSGESAPGFQRGQVEFKAKKDSIIPLLQEAITASADAQKKEEVRQIFQGLDNIGADTEAGNLVVVEGLSDETRLEVAVGYINTFGFINVVDLIAAKIKDESISVELKHQLEVLYRRIQGDEAREIAAELSEVYTKIDFSQYKINEDELTRQEASEIERITQELKVIQEGTKDVKQIEILDLGAGTGRHSLRLRRRGFNVTVRWTPCQGQEFGSNMC